MRMMAGWRERVLSELPEWPGSPDTSHEDVISASARLCIDCGLCCTGAYLSWAAVSASEITTFANTLIRSYGPEDQGEGEDCLGMLLPCACHIDGRCSIFPNRPEICRTYVCELLRATMNGSISGDEGRAISAQTKAQFEWLRLAAEKFGYFSTERLSLVMVLQDFCSRVYPRARTVSLHRHEAEFARNAFEYRQNIDRHFQTTDDLYKFVDLKRAVDTPKPAFDGTPQQVKRLSFGKTGNLIELRNCIEFSELLSAVVKGWDIKPAAADDNSPAALRIWKNGKRYYWDSPYPGPCGGFEEPLSEPLELLRQIHSHIEAPLFFGAPRTLLYPLGGHRDW